MVDAPQEGHVNIKQATGTIGVLMPKIMPQNGEQGQQIQTVSNSAALYKPMLLQDWCAEVDKDPEDSYLIYPILPADSIVVLSGDPKFTMKTWLALFEGLTLVSGKELVSGFKPAAPINVLFFENEGGRKATRARFRMLENGLKVDIANTPGKFWWAHRSGVLIDDPVWLARLRQLVVELDIGLVVLDTWATSNSGDENDNQTVSAAVRSLNTIREVRKGVSFLLVHHLRKPQGKLKRGFQRDENGNPDDDLRGGSALAGAYETHQALRQFRPKAPIDFFLHNKDDENLHFKIVWHFDKPKQIVVPSIKQIEDQDLDDETVSNHVQRLEVGRMYTLSQICAVWGYEADKAILVIDKARNMGMLRKDGGLYAVND